MFAEAPQANPGLNRKPSRTAGSLRHIRGTKYTRPPGKTTFQFGASLTLTKVEAELEEKLIAGPKQVTLSASEGKASRMLLLRRNDRPPRSMKSNARGRFLLNDQKSFGLFALPLKFLNLFDVMAHSEDLTSYENTSLPRNLIVVSCLLKYQNYLHLCVHRRPVVVHVKH